MNDALLTLRTVLSLGAVLVLLGALVWALRRGSLTLSALAPKSAIVIETATGIGDRRQIAIVCVEGRRVLVGLTPTAISFITDLAPVPAGSGASAVDGGRR